MKKDQEFICDIEAGLNVLIDEYEAWQKKEGLKLGSADEHLFDESLSSNQRKWLSSFAARWEAASPVYTSTGVRRGFDL